MANFDAQYWKACAETERKKNKLLLEENQKLIQRNAELRAENERLRVAIERANERDQ